MLHLPARLLMTAVLFASGCSAAATPTPSVPAVAPRVANADEAKKIAIDVAAKGGYARGVYEVRKVERVTQGPFAGTWAVFLEHAPPAPPGGHCVVYVRESDGTAQLFRGE